MNVRPLSWDSAFFNLKIGELQLEKDNTMFVIPEAFDLIYVRSSKEIVIDLPKYSGTYSEIKIVFEKSELTTNTRLSPGISDVFNTEFKLEDLYDLAFESGKYSRFSMDPLFTEAHFRKLYRTWIDNSMNKTFADGFLVYQADEEICGFVTYQIKGTKAVIGLIATSRERQGQGIGTQLIKGVESQLVAAGITTLQIPTQLKNEGACNFYKKLGYSPIKTTYLKHYWRDPF
ncbi:MAG: GNAT family N-acetyltransferase [Bacteroidota bacterium]